MSHSEHPINFSTENIDPSVQGEYRKKVLDKLSGNVPLTMLNFDDDIKADMDALNAKLSSMGVKVGTIIGSGTLGGVTFNVLDKNDQVIPSVVMRVDVDNAMESADRTNPMVIQPIAKVQVDKENGEKGYFRATFVPRAKSIPKKTDEEMAQLKEDLFTHTFPLMNADGMLAHVRDIDVDQFMYLPKIETKDGKPIPVLIDMSSVKAPGSSNRGQGGIDLFLDEMNKNTTKADIPDDDPAELERLKQKRAEVYSLKASTEYLDDLRQKQADLDHQCRDDLVKAGVQLGDIPTQMDAGSTHSPVQEKKRQVE